LDLGIESRLTNKREEMRQKGTKKSPQRAAILNLDGRSGISGTKQQSIAPFCSLVNLENSSFLCACNPS
jgi:hypothetical protein